MKLLVGSCGLPYDFYCLCRSRDDLLEVFYFLCWRLGDRLVEYAILLWHPLDVLGVCCLCLGQLVAYL